MLSTLPRLIAHRGARDSAPENTLAALAEAARQGARWAEVDVMLTADGVPVLIHDDTLDRTTDGAGPVAETTFDALGRLDAGSWFHPRFTGERVPTLAEAAALLLDLGLGLNLEIKPSSPAQAVATAEVAVRTLRTLWPADRPAPLLSSFEPRCMEVARDIAPDWPRGLLLWDTPADWTALADRVGAATLHVEDSRQTAASVAAFRAGGRPVLVYTVNDPDRARTLFGWGVAAVFTDRPRAMAEAMP